MLKADLIALIQKAHDDKAAGAVADVDAEFQPLLDAANALEVAPDESGLQAQIADLKAQLDAAQVALKSEVDLEAADQDKIVALNAKIASVLSILQGV